MTGTRTYRAALAAALAVLTVSTASAQSLAGRWDATLTINGVVIPFRLDVAGDGPSLTGTLFNGDHPESTTSAKQEQGTVTLSFDHYLTKIVASPKSDGSLEGRVEGRFAGSDRYITSNPFAAVRHQPQVRPAAGRAEHRRSLDDSV